jgi:hypothetical protein
MDTAFDVSRNPNMIDGKHIVVKTLVLMITLKELKGTEMVRNEKRLLALCHCDKIPGSQYQRFQFMIAWPSGFWTCSKAVHYGKMCSREKLLTSWQPTECRGKIHLSRAYLQ